MLKTLIALVLLSTNVYADFKSGQPVEVVGKLIRNRKTGEYLGLVQNYDEIGRDEKGNPIKLMLDNYGYYILSKNKKEGFYRVVYLVKDGFTADQISALAEQAGDVVEDKFGKEFKRNKKSLGSNLWKKFRIENWESHKLIGKIWRWPVAILGFGSGKILDGAATAGKYIYAAAGTGIAELKEYKVSKALTRAGLVEFKGDVVCVKNKVFQTIVNQF